MNNYQSYFDLGKLIAKYLRQELTIEEKDQLEQWLQADTRNQELFRKLTDEVTIDSELETFEANDKDKAWQNIVKKTGFKNITRKKTAAKLWPYAAAIIVLIASAITLTRYFNTSGEQKMAIKPQKDLPPGSNKAILTLADGSKVVLDDSKQGKIANQQNIIITKDKSGELVYQAAESAKPKELPQFEKVVMNMLATPRGGQYQIVLPDGTRVWLNSASSLKYPAAFVCNERRVELNGEAYFEVSKDPSKPFYVKTATQTVMVLGTHFNINSYTDEAATKTTLLEGSVKVTGNATGASAKLKPGEQAVNTINAIEVKENADIDEAVAWKNGKFLFRNTDLHTIMRQLSRWYDVDVEYQGNVVQKHYRGRISRNVPVSEIFQILKTSGINFTIDGRKIIVRS